MSLRAGCHTEVLEVQWGGYRNAFRLPLIAAAGLSPFVLKQKDQKFKTAGRLLCALGLCPAKPAEPGLESFYPLLRRSWPALQ